MWPKAARLDVLGLACGIAYPAPRLTPAPMPSSTRRAWNVRGRRGAAGRVLEMAIGWTPQLQTQMLGCVMHESMPAASCANFVTDLLALWRCADASRLGAPRGGAQGRPRGGARAAAPAAHPAPRLLLPHGDLRQHAVGWIHPPHGQARRAREGVEVPRICTARWATSISSSPLRGCVGTSGHVLGRQHRLVSEEVASTVRR